MIDFNIANSGGSRSNQQLEGDLAGFDAPSGNISAAGTSGFRRKALPMLVAAAAIGFASNGNAAFNYIAYQDDAQQSSGAAAPMKTFEIEKAPGGGLTIHRDAEFESGVYGELVFGPTGIGSDDATTDKGGQKPGNQQPRIDRKPVSLAPAAPEADLRAERVSGEFVFDREAGERMASFSGEFNFGEVAAVSVDPGTEMFFSQPASRVDQAVLVVASKPAAYPVIDTAPEAQNRATSLRPIAKPVTDWAAADGGQTKPTVAKTKNETRAQARGAALIAQTGKMVEAGVATQGEFVDYVVRPGEILGRIARKHKVSIGEIVAANDIKDVNRIIAGATIRIPVSSMMAKAPAIQPIDIAQAVDGGAVRARVDLASVDHHLDALREMVVNSESVMVRGGSRAGFRANDSASRIVTALNLPAEVAGKVQIISKTSNTRSGGDYVDFTFTRMKEEVANV